MAILQLKSDNSKFSYIIRKNPESGMQVRSMRKGLVFGWFSDTNNYNVYFRDGDNDISYVQNQDEQFEYLNVSRYNSPLFILNSISEFFSHNFKNQDEDDVEGYNNSIYLNLVEAQLTRYIDFFRREYPDITIDYEEVAHKSLRIKITTTKSIHYLINITNLLALFLSFVSKIYIDVNEGMVEKYLDCLNRLNSSYFIRYLFKRNLLKNRKLFDKFKEKLESYDKYNIHFTYGDNFHQRKNTITNLLDFKHDIIDIGCGEGNYLFNFTKKLENNHYFAYDIDEEQIDIINKKVSFRNIENVTAICTDVIDAPFIDFSIKSKKYDVIITEVIEHMSIENATKLIKNVIKNIDFNNIIITTPNKNFNSYFGFKENELRWDDHIFEFAYLEFRDFISRITDIGMITRFFDIGDSISDINGNNRTYTTHGVVISKI